MRTAGLVVAGAALSGVLASGHGALRAQADQAFEVVSIRRNVSGDQLGGGLAAPLPGGRFIAVGATLRRLVSDAYDDIEIVGGPAWIASDRFDVDARAPGNPTAAQIRRMLRAVLAERFGLVVHTEPRDLPIYVLELARQDRRLGPGLRASDAVCAEQARNFFPATSPAFPPPCGDFRLGARALTARGVTMPGLAGLLRERVGRPVVDRTGLDGAYDLDVEWSSDAGLNRALPDSAGAGELTVDGLSLFTAFQEQLGLRLEATRGLVDVLVIDRAQPPSPD